MLLKLDETTLVNTDHVIEVKYTPARMPGFDSDNQEEISGKSSKVEVWITALEIERTADDFASGYYLAAAGTSRVLIFSGGKADQVWDKFLRGSAT